MCRMRHIFAFLVLEIPGYVKYYLDDSMIVGLEPDCWDEHFLFYNLQQNRNGLGDIHQVRWNLGYSSKGRHYSEWYYMKSRQKFDNFCSILFQKIFTSDMS